MAEKKHTQDPLDMEEALSTSEAFIIKYKSRILGAIAAVVIIIAGFMGYKHFISEPNEIKGFLKVADEFSGTAAGNLANAYAGVCYAQLGKYEEAVKYLNKFSADDQLVSPALLGTMGNCYAQAGQLDKAAATLMKAADKADSQALSPIYLIQAGQIYEKLGKNSEAVNAYTLIKNKYFNSYQSMDIDKYIERASIK